MIGDTPPGCDRALWALVAPLRAARTAQGLTQGQLGDRLGCDRSRVSRALSGRTLPSRERAVELARVLGVDEAETGRRWEEAAARVRDARACRGAGGAPPPGHASHMDVMDALRDLLRELGVSQRELERRDPGLRRSTVGAVLRGERSARLDLVIAIVRACGLPEEAVSDWESIWARHCLPDLRQRYERKERWLRDTAVPHRWRDRW